MSLKVSVVIPVYNPGPYIDKCISTLLGQTMPADEFEIIFVDDGSTDDTPGRLDKLADEQANVRTIHIPNSGWPGRPRNVGAEAARGEYIHYVDQDDYMGADALRRLYDLGHRNQADIVIGKTVSNWRPVPYGMWKHTRERVTIHDFPLWNTLTVHKMFRTAFLNDEKIRFPEGKRRLEDQLYMMQAYFPAKVVSILSDYTCYYYWRRADKKNAGSTLIEPVGYYDNLRDVLDVVEKNTEPGEFRDRILRRFFRAEMIGRLADAALLWYEPGYRADLFAEIRKLADERMTSEVTDANPALLRMKTSLLRADRLDTMVELAERCRLVKAETPLESVRWSHGRLRLQFAVELRGAGGAEPLELCRRDGRFYLDPSLSDGLLDWRDGDVDAELPGIRVDVSIRNRKTAAEWVLPARIRVSYDEDPATDGDNGVRVRVRAEGSVTVDPESAAGGRPLDKGIWDIWARVLFLGFDKRTRLGTTDVARLYGGCQPALVGGQSLLVVPYFTAGNDNLSLDVGRHAKTLASALEGRTWTPLPGTGKELALSGPVIHPSGSPAVRTELVLRNVDEATDDSTHVLPADLLADSPGTRLVSKLAGISLTPGSRWRVFARLDGDDLPETLVGYLDVDPRRRAYLEGARRISVPQLVTRRLAHALVTGPSVRQAARRLVARTPSRWRGRLKTLANQVQARNAPR